MQEEKKPKIYKNFISNLKLISWLKKSLLTILWDLKNKKLKESRMENGDRRKRLDFNWWEKFMNQERLILNISSDWKKQRKLKFKEKWKNFKLLLLNKTDWLKKKDSKLNLQRKLCNKMYWCKLEKKNEVKRKNIRKRCMSNEQWNLLRLNITEKFKLTSSETMRFWKITKWQDLFN